METQITKITLPNGDVATLQDERFDEMQESSLIQINNSGNQIMIGCVDGGTAGMVTIKNLSAPTGENDAATKSYVDSQLTRVGNYNITELSVSTDSDGIDFTISDNSAILIISDGSSANAIGQVFIRKETSNITVTQFYIASGISYTCNDSILNVKNLTGSVATLYCTIYKGNITT